MRRIVMLFLAATMAFLGLGGCDPARNGWLDDDTAIDSPDTPPDTPDPTLGPFDLPPFPEPAVCDYCVHTPPATFTGPSLFWRGLYGAQPDCAAPTPYQGIEGHLLYPTRFVNYVRECRFTASDTCETEGKVCAPYPDPDFSICIHHTDTVDCPSEYSVHEEAIFVEGDNPFVFTLCCMAAIPTPT